MTRRDILSFMVFHCRFPMSQRVKGDLVQPRILQFLCKMSHLFREVLSMAVKALASETFSHS